MPEHFVFPSRRNNRNPLQHGPPGGDLLASSTDALPDGGEVLRGPRSPFVADSNYDYANLWHALNAISPFFAWMTGNGFQAPARFVLFKNGEVAKEWARGSASSVVVDDMGSNHGVVCFEKAVVFRRGLGRMAGERRHALFEMLRCRAWEFCNKQVGEGG